jgi:MFS superfamily sulfate permease-like transporter
VQPAVVLAMVAAVVLAMVAVVVLAMVAAVVLAMVAAVVLAMVAAAQPKSECTCAKKAEGTQYCDSTRSSWRAALIAKASRPR